MTDEEILEAIFRPERVEKPKEKSAYEEMIERLEKELGSAC